MYIYKVTYIYICTGIYSTPLGNYILFLYFFRPPPHSSTYINPLCAIHCKVLIYTIRVSAYLKHNNNNIILEHTTNVQGANLSGLSASGHRFQIGALSFRLDCHCVYIRYIILYSSLPPRPPLSQIRHYHYYHYCHELSSGGCV